MCLFRTQHEFGYNSVKNTIRPFFDIICETVSLQAQLVLKYLSISWKIYANTKRYSKLSLSF